MPTATPKPDDITRLESAGEKEKEGIDKALELVNDVIDKIGMGRYQWSLFFLCGCGWLADNLWLQGLATILPDVQRTFGISDSISGLGTSATFIGMMFGASFWGLLCDVIGRRPSFNLTLFFGALFGSSAALAPSFPVLCVLFGLMGFGVGGNLPVDGALFLEFVPRSRQNLLTLLSVFWPFGTLVASVAGWALIPRFGCDPNIEWSAESGKTCSNPGWRYVLAVLGAFTFIFFFGRFALFRLHESPKFLLTRGRVQEAVEVLRKLAEGNGVEIAVEEEDFWRLLKGGDLDAEGENEDEEVMKGVDGKVGKVNMGHSTGTAAAAPTPAAKSPRFSKAAVANWWGQVKLLFARELIITTILVWMIWMLIAVGYTMFNGFLPKFLENASEGTTPKTLDDVYKEYLIVSVAGIPGSVL
ncbi:hypothetical protein HK102_007629, partial [Quaeritorhiza haematococci]